MGRRHDPGYAERAMAWKRARQRTAIVTPRLSERTDLSLPECECTSPPWEECVHTGDGIEFDPDQLEHLRSIAHSIEKP